MSYEEYVALSDEEQLRYALSEAEGMLVDAEAILDASGTWITIPQPEAEQKRAVGFGEGPAESDFD